MSDRASPDEDDVVLVRRIRQNKEEYALALLYQRYVKRVVRLLRRRFGDLLQDCEYVDAVNAAFRCVWKFVEKFDPQRGSFKSWLAKIAHNKAADILRAADKRHPPDQFPEGYDPVDGCDDDSSPALERDVQRMLILDEVIAKDLKGLEKIVAEQMVASGDAIDYDRLARITGAKRETLYTTRSKIKAKLRKRVEAIERNRKGDS